MNHLNLSNTRILKVKPKSAKTRRLKGCPPSFSAFAWTCGILLTAAGLAGCRTPRAHRQAADRVGRDIINSRQQELFDRDKEFDVQSPAEQLRRRLLLDHYLPTAFSGSAGIRHIEPIPEISDREYLAMPSEALKPPWLDRPAGDSMIISLEEALQIAARNSHDYQDAKERVFIAALDLDLERNAFRNSWQGLLSSSIDTDLSGANTVTWINQTGTLELSRRFASGALMTAQLGVNLVNLLTGSRDSSVGLIGDASISIPLMRGAGRFVATEPMTQAERNVVYALYDFERFRRTFAVRVGSEFLTVLQQYDRVRNAEENYRSLVASARRARRLADMGRLPEIQVDQAAQDELRARDRWIGALQALERSQDTFKQLLGLPTDARLEPDSGELERIGGIADELIHETPAPVTESTPPQDPDANLPVELDYPDKTEGGPFEMEYDKAILIAFDNRLDMRIAIGRIHDAQRSIAIAADRLRADLSLLGRLSVGERRSVGTAGASNAHLRFDEGRYGGLLNLNLPLERTAERNNYRIRWIELERRVRNAQKLEDQIKFELRQGLRTLLEARESVRIQKRSLEVAKRRVRGTELFLQQGRAQIRDVLEARESLVSAENALTAAVIRYRVAELEFQRDLGVLEVDLNGLWTEFQP